MLCSIWKFLDLQTNLRNQTLEFETPLNTKIKIKKVGGGSMVERFNGLFLNCLPYPVDTRLESCLKRSSSLLSKEQQILEKECIYNGKFVFYFNDRLVLIGSRSNGTKSIECRQANAKATIIDQMSQERMCFDRTSINRWL